MKAFITITGLKFHFDSKPFAVGQKVKLVKEPDNEYDSEAIKAELPGLRHLAWNIGERLGVPLAKRAVFIKKSFPYELVNATLEYLRLNLRDNVPSQIPIDVPDKGDYRFHLDVDNDDSQ